MALSVTDRGVGGNNTTGTTLVISGANGVTGDLAVGSTAVLVVSMDNANSPTANVLVGLNGKITDSAGNDWYVRFDNTGGAALSIAEPAILTSLLTHTFLAASTTLTLNFVTTNSTLCKAWTLSEVKSDISGCIALTNYMTTTGILNVTTVTTNASPSMTNIFPCINDVVIGFAVVEWSDILSAGSVDTTNGTWSPAQHFGVGAASAAGISVVSQSKVCSTGSGTMNYTVTLASSADWRAGYIQFAETDAKAVYNSGSSTSEAATTIVVTQPISLNSMAVLAVAADNDGAGGTTPNFPTSITDSKTNVWTLQQDQPYNISGTGSGAEIALYTAIIGTPLVPGDTIIITYVNGGTVPVIAKAGTIWEFKPIGGGNTMSYVSSGNNSGSTGGTPSVTTTSISNGDFVLAAGAAEGSNTFVGATSNVNGNWQVPCMAARVAGTPGMAIISQWKQVTGSGSQVFNPTLTSADNVLAWVEIHDSAFVPTGLSVQRKSSFFRFM